TCPNAQIEENNDFYHIRKIWEQGDSVEIIFTADIRLIPYPNDEYSLQYGALQFALPIAHNMKAIKSYSLENFHDYDIIPQHIADAYHIPLLDESQPNY
ncbi:MAG TPA: hypothetical protein PLZ51_10195, partial [Aggregatilineales bacterium]|nr:hypothetical protein [Aggregatilineales bacterium]